MRVVLLAALWLSASCIPAQATTGQEPLVRGGKHFQVRLHAGDLPPELAVQFADQASALVEDFWPAAQKLVRARDDGKRYDIHLYALAADYRAAETSGSPYRCRVDAFTSKELVGHVLLTPQLTNEQFTIVGLPYDTRQGLLHVAAEQIVAPVVPKDDDGWCRLVLVMAAIEAATNPEHRLVVDTEFDRRRGQIAHLRMLQVDVSLESFLSPDLTGNDAAYKRFAETQCALVGQLLATGPANWASQLMTKLAQPTKKDRVSRRHDVVAAILGKDWKSAQSRFEALCDTMHPMWQVERPCVDVGRERTLLAATGDVSACIRFQPERREGPFTIHGKAELGPGATQPMHVTLGWDGKTMVGVTFGEGRATIGLWRESDKQWHVESRADVPIATGKPFAFAVEVTATEVRALVDGALACTWPHTGYSVQFLHFLEVWNRIVWVQDLVIEDLPARAK
ncbi:MAG: hypothetical protein U1E73_06875 [Planctomycetota bacterium]